MKQFLYNLPWQDILNWIAGVGIPALLAIWRKQAMRQNRTLTAVVQGIEESTAQLGDTAFIVKSAINNKAIDAGVKQHLDNVISKATDKPKDIPPNP